MTPLPPLTIRRGNSSDVSDILTLLQGAALPTADLTSAERLQMWVLEVNSSLVGVVALERFDKSALLRSLAVAPDHQKRGLGRQLVAYLERDAQAAGVEQLVLLTETAVPFFRSLRYRVVDRDTASDDVRQSAEFLSLCPVSATCMAKTLI